MEASAARGGPLPVPSPSPQPPRKEWRAISDHPSLPSNGNENSEQVKLGQSVERRGLLDVDFCSITIDGGGGLSHEIVQQRIQEISRQREELQHMEIEMRAQAIAMSEILEVQNSFQSQIRENADAASKLKEKLDEREKHIRELEMKLEENDRELRAIKLDYEAAWAKDDLLREQNKELASFRRERDNSEAERAQYLKQIHDLQELIQDKESQFHALEEQHRVAQETIVYKEEQLREAQAWMARVHEQSTTLQAEIRERTEQFNQYWIALHRQFADVEHRHIQTIHQLQLELAEVKERSGLHKEGAKVAHQSSEDSSSYVQSEGNQINTNDVTTSNGNVGFMSNGNMEAHPSYVASSSSPAKTEQAAGLTIAPSPMLGIGAFLPPNQMAALPPFVMHPQGIPQSVTSSHVPESQIGHFQPVSTIPPQQHWHNQQAVAVVSQNPSQNNYQSSQADQSLLRVDAQYNYEIPTERKVILQDPTSTHVEQQQRSAPLVSGSGNEDKYVLESNDKQHQTSQELKETSGVNTSFCSTIGSTQPEQKNAINDQISVSALSQSQEKNLASGQQWSAAGHSTYSNNVAESDEKVVIFPESTSKINTTPPSLPTKSVEPNLLDERSLLACIVRAVPAGADRRIRISSTLPNRLGKMLAPLHWHDYKKQYGKLDEFVAHHPELFVIEGDFIYLREGAQEIISATTAYAKVAAATASSSQHSPLFPSVALTPVAQNNRHKTVPSVDLKPPSSSSFLEGTAVSKPGDSSDKMLQIPKSQSQQPNGVGFNVVRGMADVNISAKSKNLQEVIGVPSEGRPAHSSVQSAVGNGTNKVYANGRLNSVGKQARSTGAGIISRR